MIGKTQVHLVLLPVSEMLKTAVLTNDDRSKRNGKTNTPMTTHW
jgi:hypothetical protein